MCAAIAGAAIPNDRAIDGVDQSAFLLGKSEASAREGFPAWPIVSKRSNGGTGSSSFTIAQPGTICLSEDAYRQVRARLDLEVHYLG